MRVLWSLLALLALAPVASAQAASPTCASSFPPAEDDGRPTHGSVGCRGPLDVPLRMEVVRRPAHGTLTDIEDRTSPWGSTSELPRYTPTAGYRGADSFAVRATVNGESVEHVVALTVVAPVDDPPTCVSTWTNVPLGPGPVRLDAGETAHGNVVCGDDEGAALDITLAQGPQHGVLGGLTPFSAPFQGVRFSYTPAVSRRGPDRFVVRASDGGLAVLHPLEIEVIEPTDAAPMCFGVPYLGPTGPNGHPRVPAGTPIELTFSCGDPEGATLGFALLRAPAHGTAALAQPDRMSVRVTYTPEVTFRGVDELTLRMTDGPHTVDRTYRLDVVEPDATPAPQEDPPVAEPTSSPSPAPVASVPAPPPAKVVVGPHVKPVSSVELRIATACGKLKGARRATCARRERALARCAALKAGTRKQKAAKAACVKRAKRIGAKR
jgi:hypothetical protein